MRLCALPCYTRRGLRHTGCGVASNEPHLLPGAIRGLLCFDVVPNRKGAKAPPTLVAGECMLQITLYCPGPPGVTSHAACAATWNFEPRARGMRMAVSMRTDGGALKAGGGRDGHSPQLER